jgi:hypothetical protein
LKIWASVYLNNEQPWKDDDNVNNNFIIARIGIGMTYATAKWYYLSCSTGGVISHGWGDVKTKVYLVVNQTIKGTGVYTNMDQIIEGIPVPATLYGYVFIDIIGALYRATYNVVQFAIGNLKIEFSRDQIYIPASTSQSSRQRKVKKDRVASHEYTSLNTNAIKTEQNIDLVYASDNNMKYGFGLMMNQGYSYMGYAEYNGGRWQERPEQHYANRIADFWEESKRVLQTDLRTDVVEENDPITPLSHLVLDNGHYRTLAVSHQWRDDVTTVKMIQSLIEIE